MINEVSNKMFAEFTSNFRARLERERVPASDPAKARIATAEPRPIKALPLILSVIRDAIVRFFRRIFKGSDSL